MPSTVLRTNEYSRYFPSSLLFQKQRRLHLALLIVPYLLYDSSQAQVQIDDSPLTTGLDQMRLCKGAFDGLASILRAREQWEIWGKEEGG